MNQLYKNQSYIEIVLDTKVSLVGSSNEKILVVKGDGTKVEWTATVVGTTLVYEVQPNDFDKVGAYSLQAYFEKNGRKAFGKIVKLTILENIKQ